MMRQAVPFLIGAAVLAISAFAAAPGGGTSRTEAKTMFKAVVHVNFDDKERLARNHRKPKFPSVKLAARPPQLGAGKTQPARRKSDDS